MVGDGAGGAAQAMVPAASVMSVAWADASRIPRQHTGPCEPVGWRGVWIAAARAALVLGFPALVAQGAGGDQVRAAGGGAYLVHRNPPSTERCIALRAGVEPATHGTAHIVDGQLRKGNHDRLVVHSLESVPSHSSTAEPTEARRPSGKRQMASNHERTRTRQPVATHNSRSSYTLNGERTSNKCSACRVSRRATTHQATHPPSHATCPSQGARSHAAFPTATATRPACETHAGR